MSMYTQLLDAACTQRPSQRRTQRDVIDEVLRCHGELAEGAGAAGAEDDTVSLMLALELRYDVALMELADVLGIETGPGRFEQPHRERERLVRAIHARGVRLTSFGTFAGSRSGSAPTGVDGP